MFPRGTLWSYPYASASVSAPPLFGSVRVAEVGGYFGRALSELDGGIPGWCARILSVHPDGNPVTAVELALRSRLTPILSAAPNGVALDRTRLFAVFRDRQRPSAEDLAEFVTFRTGQLGTAALLHGIWTTVNGHPTPAEGPKERRLRRSVKQVGTFSPGHWRRVAWLARADRSPTRSVAFLAV